MHHSLASGKCWQLGLLLGSSGTRWYGTACPWMVKWRTFWNHINDGNRTKTDASSLSPACDAKSSNRRVDKAENCSLIENHFFSAKKTMKCARVVCRLLRGGRPKAEKQTLQKHKAHWCVGCAAAAPWIKCVCRHTERNVAVFEIW